MAWKVHPTHLTHGPSGDESGCVIGFDGIVIPPWWAFRLRIGRSASL
jgi:hypothetical protein